MFRTIYVYPCAFLKFPLEDKYVGNELGKLAEPKELILFHRKHIA